MYLRSKSEMMLSVPHTGSTLCSLGVALTVLVAGKLTLAGDGGEERMNSARIAASSTDTTGDHFPEYRFPFGAHVLRRSPSASTPRLLFVLGAYPSAVHVQWTPPGAGKTVRALPVDNEPEPFWEGSDEVEVVAEWKRKVRFDENQWGRVEPTGKLNGSSGVALAHDFLAPLGVVRNDVWITDVLDTYRASEGAEERIADTYAHFAVAAKAPPAGLAHHPSEDAIVQEGLEQPQRQRLMAEIEKAQPKVIVTLGNAALRVLRTLLAKDGGSVAPAALSAGRDYGKAVSLRLGGRSVVWLPLAHPAAVRTIPAFGTVHRAWIARVRADQEFLQNIRH
jgi:hypothetical protein